MKKIPVKKKLASLKPSSTLAINEKCKELTASGKKIYKFGFGQSPFPIPQSIVNCLKNNANRKNYLPMQGLPELREAISKYLTKKTGVSYSKNNIIITDLKSNVLCMSPDTKRVSYSHSGGRQQSTGSDI